MILEKDLINIGKFQKTHALKGELNAIIEGNPEYVGDHHPLVVKIDGVFVPFYADGIRGKGTFSFLIKIDGIDSEEEARLFVNKEIYAVRDIYGPYADEDDDPDGIYLEDLIGYSVIDSETGEKIGEVTDYDDATDNVLMIITTDNGDTVYVPFADDIIEDVDDENKIIMTNIPEGLIDLNKKKRLSDG